ncbi:MAG: amidohydrolase family protein, partial [Halobacteriaceae archaeon]
MELLSTYTRESCWNGRIVRVAKPGKINDGTQTTVIDANGEYLAPGFLDAHIHVESSMVTGMEFAREAIKAGTTGIFHDPHEIANVLGLEGVYILQEEFEHTPLKTFFTVPSCVPTAPGLEDSGTNLNAKDIADALERDDAMGLGEMMDFPGIINGEAFAHDRLAVAQRSGEVATGHFASRERDGSLDAYAAAGISSCHESIGRDGALARLRDGMWAMLRQGTSWQNVPETVETITTTDVDPRHLLLVTDDVNAKTMVKSGHL